MKARGQLRNSGLSDIESLPRAAAHARLYLDLFGCRNWVDARHVAKNCADGLSCVIAPFDSCDANVNKHC
jgi:hypothetical protein